MKTLRLIAILLPMILTAFWVEASKVDTLAVYSASMNKKVGVSVITPEGVDKGERLPVVYLLHGYGDNHLHGYLKLTEVRRFADCLRMIVVTPDGDSSWYFDSPVDSTFRYETFVSKELVSYIDSHYPTIADRNHRAITGLSMGGHGALYLAIRHQDEYGAAGSMSGGVDFRPFPENWDIKKRLGGKGEYPDNWERNTVFAQLPQLKPDALRLVIDCGTEDFFYEVNCNLHKELSRLKIPHEFTTRPGAHNWKYWQRSLRDHLLFFSDFFKENDIENN